MKSHRRTRSRASRLWPRKGIVSPSLLHQPSDASGCREHSPDPAEEAERAEILKLLVMAGQLAAPLPGCSSTISAAFLYVCAQFRDAALARALISAGVDPLAADPTTMDSCIALLTVFYTGAM